jgi:hypothetical protein
MALPTTQTLDTICIQGLKRAGISDYTAAELTNAKDEYVRDILDDLFAEKDWKILEHEDIAQLNNFVSEIALPTDMLKLLSLRLLTGQHSDTLQAGTTSSLTLAAAEDITEQQAEGSPIVILSGSASGEWSRITAYNETTKVAGVSPSFSTAPGAATYMIVDEELELTPDTREAITIRESVDPPTHYAIYNDPRMLYLNGYVNSDDYVYALLRRYSLNIDQVDLTDARMTRIYDEYRFLLVQGVMAYQMRDNDDSRYDREMSRFDRLMAQAKKKDNRARAQRGMIKFRGAGGMPRE